MSNPLSGMTRISGTSLTQDELRTLSDATLLHIAKNVKHYEANESRDELVLELARRLEVAKANLSNTLNLLLKDGWE